MVYNALDLPRRTAAEIAREKKLRDDPMAEVHGPLYVSCRRCGARIKLSPKSTYDPFHWTKHRERCLRKPVGVARNTRRDGRGARRKSGAGGSSKISSSSSSKEDVDSATPPLTPDLDGGESSADIKEESPAPSSSEAGLSTMYPSLSPPDPILEEYLNRSRHAPIQDAPVEEHERWQTWHWDQLRLPIWMEPISMASNEQNDDDDIDSDTSTDDLPTPLILLSPTRLQDKS